MTINYDAIPESRFAWLMLAVSVVIIGMAMGTLTSISVFLKPLVSEFGWLRGQTALAFTSGAIAMGLGGIVMGHLADRYSIGVPMGQAFTARHQGY